MCGGLGFGAGGGSLPLDFTAAMTAAIPTSREPMASIAFQTSSMSHLLYIMAAMSRDVVVTNVGFDCAAKKK